MDMTHEYQIDLLLSLLFKQIFSNVVYTKINNIISLLHNNNVLLF